MGNWAMESLTRKPANHRRQGQQDEAPGKACCRGGGGPDDGAATGGQPESESLSSRPLPSSSLALSSSPLSLEEELSSSVKLSTHHPKRTTEFPKTMTESRPLSINLKWRMCPSVKLWVRAKAFHPRRRYMTWGRGKSTSAHMVPFRSPSCEAASTAEPPAPSPGRTG